MPLSLQSYALPTPDVKRVLHFAKMPIAEEHLEVLVASCIHEAKAAFSPRVASVVADLPLGEAKDARLSSFAVSKELVKHLQGCDKALFFVATVGVGIDRLVARYSAVSPSRALLLQALGTERIETLCDVFCHEFAASHNVITTSRFSPGYGDLPLSLQRELLECLQATKYLGVTLNDSMLMSPTKSVTAVVGLKNK